MARMDVALLEILAADHPQTVRGTFYQATVRGIVDKTEAGYRTVQRAPVPLRQRGLLPYGYIADSTRWMRKPRSFDGLEDALRESWRHYRRALWTSQRVNVEVLLPAGHTHSPGPASHNQQMTVPSADPVKQLLLGTGVQTTRIYPRGHRPTHTTSSNQHRRDPAHHPPGGPRLYRRV